VLAVLATSQLAAADVASVSLYADRCAMCHGADGKGDGPMGKKLKTADWSDGKTLEGMTDAEVGKVIRVGKAAMPDYPKLTDAQLAAMVAYLRTFQKPAAP